MKRILALSFAGVILVANNVSSGSVAAAGGTTTHQAVQTSPRLEIVFATHVIELVEKNAGDDSEAAEEARKLLKEPALTQLRADLEEILGDGDELKRAKKFRDLWKEMDVRFGKSDDKKFQKWFPDSAVKNLGAPSGAATSGGAASAPGEPTPVGATTAAVAGPQKAPWPLCVPKGCK